MYDVSCMQILDGTTSLDDESSDFWHGEVFALLNSVGEGSIVADFKDNVGTCLVREGSMKFDNVRMV